MEILPAIDLKMGKAVRLQKGAMESAKIYGEPREFAKRFEDLGAKWLHLVDLDGAFAGDTANFDTIEQIAKETSLKIEIGGGIRNEESIKRYLNLGVARCILGSVALREPDFTKQMCAKYAIAVGIDAVDGFVAVQGWGEVSQMKASGLAKIYANSGAQALICTDISKDGMLSGVNVGFTREMALASGIATIASGGVAGIEDIRKVRECGEIYGVIIGKAFYEGRIDLNEAFKVAQNG